MFGIGGCEEVWSDLFYFSLTVYTSMQY